ncbi:MAG: cation acetate symporter [Thermomicrobium sp.]|nr:cation acetate symporter [Thermomicrobium sp.]
MSQEAGYTPLTRAQLSEFRRRLAKYYGAFFVFLIVFTLVLYLFERAGLPHRFIGYAFIFLTLALYAFIGILNFTRRLEEYYVAGRRVPAIFNGMATGADWMSAASFISMAGTLWLLGYDGLAYIMGWTGGYVLLALLFAPYIRKFGQYTIPDFVATRYGERARLARFVAAICAIIVSLAYVTAQVTGVGIIMSRFFGLDYRVGVFVGLAGVLVCSFLGGMKSITWTQVAQYIILIVAYLIPVTFLSAKLTGVPFPQLMYGKALSEITQLEQAMKLPSYIQPFKQALSNASAITAFKQIGITPPEPITVKDWVGTPWQFLALTLCLMAGTVGLPHILIRYYTVPSPKEARISVGWSLFFIWLLYVTAPAYAAFSRWEVLQNVVGQPINALPEWTANWIRTGLLKITDANNDGILQFSELSINGDIVVLATPEIAGLPFTIAALVAAGGLAAALSTADGLLLVISTAVAHDIYAKIINPNAPYGRRFLLSRLMILIAAVIAALLAIPQFALIVQLVAWAFSLAASTFFPVVLLGIFWKRANANGAIAGMIGGLVACFVYMIWNYVDPRFNVLGLSHLSAGIFGMAANFLLTIVLSLLTAPSPKYIQDMVDQLRIPVGEMRLPAPGTAPGAAPGVAPAGQD